MIKSHRLRIASATQHACMLITKYTIGIKYSGCDITSDANFQRRHFCNTKVRNLVSNIQDMNEEIMNGEIDKALKWADCIINTPIPDREEYDPENQDEWEHPTK